MSSTTQSLCKKKGHICKDISSTDVKKSSPQSTTVDLELCILSSSQWFLQQSTRTLTRLIRVKNKICFMLFSKDKASLFSFFCKQFSKNNFKKPQQEQSKSINHHQKTASVFCVQHAIILFNLGLASSTGPNLHESIIFFQTAWHICNHFSPFFPTFLWQS